MSATEQMRAMLDGLMGTARDGSDATRQHLHFSDSRICRAFLLDCCPHDIFASTKLDLGECSKVHDHALRADYLLANKTEDLGYEHSALDRLQAFVSDADRRTDYLKRKLAETQEELTAEETNKLNMVHDLTEKLGKKLAQIEKAEADGEQELKLKCMEEVDKIKKERAVAEVEYKEVSRPAASHQQQNLRVCDVCSAYLGINDNDARLADHFGGKLHLGFITIREKLEDLKRRCNEGKNGRSSSRRNNREHNQRDHHNHRNNSRDYHNDRHSYESRYESSSSYHHHQSSRNSRDRERERDRGIRDTDKYRERDRSRGHGNSRYTYRDAPPMIPRYGGPNSRDIAPSSRDLYHTSSSSRMNDNYSSSSVRYVREERSLERERPGSRERYSSRGVGNGSMRGPFDRSKPDTASSRGGYDDREIAYQRKLRDWEKREADKSRKYAIREVEERDKRSLEEQESRKLKEFLEDYKDDRDDLRFYSGSGLQRRLADRRKEIEQDEAARQKEKIELEILSRSCAVNSDTSPRPIENISQSSETMINNLVGHNKTTVTVMNVNAIVNGTNKSKLIPNTAAASKSNQQSQQQTSQDDLTGTINLNASSASAAAAKPQSVANNNNNSNSNNYNQTQSKGANSEDKRKLVSELIGRIPTDKNQLFAQELEWSLLDDNLMERRIRPWVTKKIAEYMGEQEVELIDFVCTLLNDHKDGNSMLKEVAIVLDDEAEKFVVHLWRLLIFELEAKKIGLRK